MEPRPSTTAGKTLFTYRGVNPGIATANAPNIISMLILAQNRWEGPQLPADKHTIVFDYTYDGPGIAKGGTDVLKVDGKVADTHTSSPTQSRSCRCAMRPSTSGSTRLRVLRRGLTSVKENAGCAGSIRSLSSARSRRPVFLAAVGRSNNGSPRTPSAGNYVK